MRRMLLAGLVVALTGALAVVAVTSVGAPPRTAGSGAPGPAAQPAQRGADSGPFAVAAERSRERGWGGSSEAEAEVASPAARDAPTGRRSLLGGRIVAQVTRDLADRLDVEEEQMRSALASVGRDTLSRGARDDRRRWPVLKDEALESLGRELDRSPGDVAAAARNELEAKLRLGVTFGAVSERGRDLALACFDAPQRCDLRAVRREVHGGAVRARVVLGACAAALVAAACGSGGGAAATAPRTETQAIEREQRTSTTPPASSAQQRRGIRLVAVGRFRSPLFLTSPPGDRRRQFVVEQGGRIRVVRGGRVLRRPFLDLSDRVVAGGEQGLLGLAFPPDFARTRRFYVHYTDRGGDTRVVEFRRSRSSADRADRSTARVVLAQDQPEANHNGGQLAFGPDGLLYIGLGDGGGGNDQHGERGNAQDLGTLLGKILRIDPRAAGGRPYRIPTSNPFVDRSGARGEIYAYGLRNPWRFSFDRSTGDLAIADVGQNAIEEVSFVEQARGRGANFGWRPFEGSTRIFPGEEAPGHVPPVIEKSHGDGWCSITGGYVVRDPELPGLRGRYVYGDFCQGRIRAARLRTQGAEGDRALDLRQIDSLSSFGEDAQRRVYVVSLDGPVYRLAAR